MKRRSSCESHSDLKVTMISDLKLGMRCQVATCCSAGEGIDSHLGLGFHSGSNFGFDSEDWDEGSETDHGSAEPVGVQKCS
jgi:hypothetical protein